MENTFFKLDKDGNEIALTEDEIKEAVEALGWPDDEDEEFLPPPPEEIPFNWDSLK